MTFRALELTLDLTIAVRENDWRKASEIVDKIKAILDTYKYSC